MFGRRAHSGQDEEDGVFASESVFEKVVSADVDGAADRVNWDFFLFTMDRIDPLEFYIHESEHEYAPGRFSELERDLRAQDRLLAAYVHERAGRCAYGADAGRRALWLSTEAHRRVYLLEALLHLRRWDLMPAEFHAEYERELSAHKLRQAAVVAELEGAKAVAKATGLIADREWRDQLECDFDFNMWSPLLDDYRDLTVESWREQAEAIRHPDMARIERELKSARRLARRNEAVYEQVRRDSAAVIVNFGGRPHPIAPLRARR